jgi:AhpD family alkylhydroperoxidase
MQQKGNRSAGWPPGMQGLKAVYAYVRRSGLPSRLVSLAFLRVSQINGCAYCIDLHSRDLLRNGLPTEHLLLVGTWRETGSVFSDQERAALAWAEDVTRLGEHGVSDSAYDAAAGAFGAKLLFDLTLAIALMNAYNRMAISFRASPMAVAS